MTNGSITVGNTTAPIPSFNYVATNNVAFTMPIDVPAGSGFTLVINNVQNPDFNPACGSSANTYAGTPPCDGFIQVYMVNSLNDQSQPNVYHHNGQGRYDIVQANYFVSDITVDKPNTLDAIEDSQEEELIRIKVSVSGTTGSLPTVQEFHFSKGSTLISDVRGVDLWYTNQDLYFHGTNDVLLGSFSNLSATLQFLTNFPLSKGVHYFWLSYDVACYPGIVGNSLDGIVDSIIIDNQTYTPSTPAGTRTIGRDLTLTLTNLVPNPSFENYSSCPNGIGQIGNANDWGVIPITGSTFVPSSPDFFHRCDATNSYAAVPNNGFGTQEPRTGDGYAGIYTSGFFDWKEYLQVRLNSPLQAGQTYAITYFVSAATYDSTGTVVLSRRHNGMGFYLSNTQFTSQFSLYGLPNGITPQDVNTDIIGDNMDWVPVTSTYTAQGGEEWLVIGCFLDNPNMQTDGGGGFGYYYVDDVTVSPLSDVAQTPCPTIELLIEMNPETCPGANDGTASIQAFGGTAPYSVLWSDNGTGLVRNNLAPGLYNITVTDALNNQRQDIVLIDPADPLVIDLSMVNASGTTTADGSIQASISNGTAPYTYLWSTGATSAAISNLLPGTYSLTVTDANGCTNSTTAFLGAPLACKGIFSNFPYAYDTEKGLGLFRQNQEDDRNWKRRTSPTPTANTGPSAPYSGNYFRYVESSGNNGNPGKTAVLTTRRCLNITGVQVPIFQFYYNLNGADMGQLLVQLSTDGGTPWTAPVWSTSGDQGDNWKKAVVQLSAYSSTQLRIRLVGITGNGPLSDLAIDSYYIGEESGSINLTPPPAIVQDPQVSPAEEMILPSQLKLFPNPSQGLVQLQWLQAEEGEVQIRVFDQIGRPVYRQEQHFPEGEQILSLDLDIPQGMYHVELISANERLSRSLVIIP